MIEELTEYLKILKRIESSYPISAREMADLQDRKKELYDILSIYFIDKNIRGKEHG